MKKKKALRCIGWVLGGVATVFLTMAALLPLMEHMLAVEVKTTEKAIAAVSPVPPAAEEVLVTALYITEEPGTALDAIFIEVFRPGEDTVFYLEIPVDTKVTLSGGLYKSLQAYSPELPQYLKLRVMAEGFSKEYAFTGCNRILSEALNVSVPHYVCTTKEEMEHWKAALKEEQVPADFFETYKQWISGSLSDLSEQERWIYYENLRMVRQVIEESATGTVEKDGFSISQKQVRKQLEVRIRGIEEANE